MSAIPWVLGPRHFQLYQCFQVHPTRNRAVVIAEGGKMGGARLWRGGGGEREWVGQDYTGSPRSPVNPIAPAGPF